jgi:hypothetical protein
MALGVPSDRRFKELVYALAKHFHARGVTLNMNMEVRGPPGLRATVGPRDSPSPPTT